MIKNKKAKKPEFQSTVWPFEIDTLETWAHWYPAFTPEECKKIIEIGSKKKILKGQVINPKNTKNIKVRESNISWLYPSEDLYWVFRKITDIIISLNKDYFKFDLYGFIEGFQFTHYQSPSGKYEKHIDRYKNGLVRKLSLSIQLSEPSSYEGGDFVLYDGEKSIILPKEQGKLIAFPSFTPHEVKPIIKGERYSLVAWITGPQFK